MSLSPEQPESYSKKFVKSPAHIVLAVVTGGCVASGVAVVAIIGVALYAIGWVNIPGSRAFRRWADSKDEEVRAAQIAQDMQAFEERRNSLMRRLSPTNVNKYSDIVAICKSIEEATADAAELHRKLDELSWSFLRMLDIQQALEQLAESERLEDIPSEILDAVKSVKSLEQEIAGIIGDPILLESKNRLLASRKERLAVLQRRLDKGRRAAGNLELVQAEQERLIEQAKLLRTDAIANRNSDVLSAKIDATVDHISETSKWLSEFEDFKDLMPEELPESTARIGYGTVTRATAPTVTKPAARRRNASW